MIYYSSCCGEEIKYPNSDIDICPDCKEWCDVIGIDEDAEEIVFIRENHTLRNIMIGAAVIVVFFSLWLLIIVNHNK